MPVLSAGDLSFSLRDLVMLGGGAFLLFKGTREIHIRVEGEDEAGVPSARQPGFVGTLIQIVLFDLVFSIDSVITAVGVAEEIWVMMAAIIVAMMLMLAASGPLTRFIDRHATGKMLALSFLLLIGMMLVADGFGCQVPRGYIYAAMGFSMAGESLNLLASRRRRMRRMAVQPAITSAPVKSVPVESE
jgi:predicted tellurium resistance membrane protein TerC